MFTDTIGLKINEGILEHYLFWWLPPQCLIIYPQVKLLAGRLGTCVYWLPITWQLFSRAALSANKYRKKKNINFRCSAYPSSTVYSLVCNSEESSQGSSIHQVILCLQNYKTVDQLSIEFQPTNPVKQTWQVHVSAHGAIFKGDVLNIYSYIYIYT